MVTRDEIPIVALVDRFYGHIRRDPRLAPVFRATPGEDAARAAHLAGLTDFWSSDIRYRAMWIARSLRLHLFNRSPIRKPPYQASGPPID